MNIVKWSISIALAVSSSVGWADPHEGPVQALKRSAPAGEQKSCLGVLDENQHILLENMKSILGNPSLPPDVRANRVLEEVAKVPKSQQAGIAALVRGMAVNAQRNESLLKSPLRGELERFGVSFENGKPNFSKVNFDKATPEFKELLSAVYPESKERIAGLGKAVHPPVYLGDTVVMGADPSVQGGEANGSKVLDQKTFEFLAHEQARRVERAFRDYLEASNSASSTTNLIAEGFQNYWNHRADTDTTRNKIRMEKQLSRVIDGLQWRFGVSAEEKMKISQQLRDALKEDDTRREMALRGVYQAAAAAAFSPLLWPAAAVGAAVVGTTAAVQAMALTATAILYRLGKNAQIDAQNGQGTEMCNLGKNLLDYGPAGLVVVLSAPFVFGAYAYSVATVSGAVTAAGATGLVEAAGIGAGTALLSTPSIHRAVTETKIAEEESQRAREARKLGHEERAQLLEAQAAKTRSSARESAAMVLLPVAARKLVPAHLAK